MFVITWNMYDKEITKLLGSNLIGVFDSIEKVESVINKMFRDMNAPERYRASNVNGYIFTPYLETDNCGIYCEDASRIYYVYDFVVQRVTLNKVS